MTDNLPPQEPTPQPEPSVLDYVKSLFRFGRGERIQLPSFVEERPEEISDQSVVTSEQSAAISEPAPALESTPQPAGVIQPVVETVAHPSLLNPRTSTPT